MTRRPIFRNPFLWIASSCIAALIVIACSSSNNSPSSTGPTSCSAGDTVGCTCSNGQTGTGLCGEPSTCSCNQGASSSGGSSSGSSSGTADEDGGHNGDGGHLDDGATPVQLYGACATKGSFGWPCTETATGLDPTDCTDPNYPYCFVGGQGTWCTALCDEDAGDNACLEAADASGATGLDGGGCIPSACNAKGYCK